MKTLTYADVEDIEVGANWLPIDYLAAVAERASIIYDKEKQQERAMERRIKNSLFHIGEASLCRSNRVFKKPTKPFPCLDASNQEILTTEKNFKKVVVRFSDKICVVPYEEVLKETSRDSCSMKGSKRNRSESEDCVENFRVIKKMKGNGGRTKVDENDHNPPPPLPEAYKKCIQGLAQGKSVSQEKLVIQKKLFDTDLSKTHNRLSIPFKKIVNSFLDEDEEHKLGLRNGKNMESMVVPLIDPLLKSWEVSLRRWEMKKEVQKNTSTSYVLCKPWNSIQEENGLKTEMVVQLWALRVDGDLWFALVKEPQDHQSGQQSGNGDLASCSSNSTVAKASSSSSVDHD